MASKRNHHDKLERSLRVGNEYTLLGRIFLTKGYEVHSSALTIRYTLNIITVVT